jgi:hypothetical protein
MSKTVKGLRFLPYTEAHQSASCWWRQKILLHTAGAVARVSVVCVSFLSSVPTEWHKDITCTYRGLCYRRNPEHKKPTSFIMGSKLSLFPRKKRCLPLLRMFTKKLLWKSRRQIVHNPAYKMCWNQEIQGELNPNSSWEEHYHYCGKNGPMEHFFEWLWNC